MARFSLQQTSTILEGPRYQLTTRVTTTEATTDVHVFVYRVGDNRFSHFAALPDMLNYPRDSSAAQATGQAFYRRDCLTRAWDTVADMQQDAAETVRRLRALANALAQQQQGFEGVRHVEIVGV